MHTGFAGELCGRSGGGCGEYSLVVTAVAFPLGAYTEYAVLAEEGRADEDMCVLLLEEERAGPETAERIDVAGDTERDVVTRLELQST